MGEGIESSLIIFSIVIFLVGVFYDYMDEYREIKNKREEESKYSRINIKIIEDLELEKINKESMEKITNSEEIPHQAPDSLDKKDQKSQGAEKIKRKYVKKEDPAGKNVKAPKLPRGKGSKKSDV